MRHRTLKLLVIVYTSVDSSDYKKGYTAVRRYVIVRHGWSETRTISSSSFDGTTLLLQRTKMVNSTGLRPHQGLSCGNKNTLSLAISLQAYRQGKRPKRNSDTLKTKPHLFKFTTGETADADPCVRGSALHSPKETPGVTGENTTVPWKRRVSSAKVKRDVEGYGRGASLQILVFVASESSANLW